MPSHNECRVHRRERTLGLEEELAFCTHMLRRRSFCTSGCTAISCPTHSRYHTRKRRVRGRATQGSHSSNGLCRRDHQAALVRRALQGDDHLDRSSRDALSVGATATSIAIQQETACSEVQRRSNTRRPPTLVCKTTFRTTDASDAYTCRAQKHKRPYRGALRQSVQEQPLDFGMKSRWGSIKRIARVVGSARCDVATASTLHAKGVLDTAACHVFSLPLVCTGRNGS